MGKTTQKRMPRIYSAADKRKLSQGIKLLGKSSVRQQNYLVSLGVGREKAVAMSKYAASQEIDRLLAKKPQKVDKDKVWQLKQL